MRHGRSAKYTPIATLARPTTIQSRIQRRFEDEDDDDDEGTGPGPGTEARGGWEPGLDGRLLGRFLGGGGPEPTTPGASVPSSVGAVASTSGLVIAPAGRVAANAPESDVTTEMGTGGR